MRTDKRRTRRGFLGTTLAALAAAAAPWRIGANGRPVNPQGDWEERSSVGKTIRLPARYYQQFDADYSLEVPAEGYGGWKSSQIELSWDHTALVVMHAWDARTREEYPGWYRAVEYLPRAEQICQTVFPKLLGTVRKTGFRLFHVVGGGDYYKAYPGYRKTVELAGPSPRVAQIPEDPVLRRLREFRDDNVFVGRHNQDDVRRAFADLDFAPEARPLADEPIAEDGHQLYALCQHYGVNHLIYAGFAVNWCILMSPGGMVDMSRHGVMCSVLRQAVTAVENKETARREINKELALWRVSLAFGFVFDVDDFLVVLASSSR